MLTNSQKPMNDAKKMMSRSAITPRVKPLEPLGDQSRRANSATPGEARERKSVTSG